MAIRTAAAAASLTLLALALSAAGQSSAPTTSAQAMQLPPDQAHFQAANATVDPQHRIAALEQFLRDYPKSKRAASARHLVLDLLLAEPHPDEARIHAVAAAMVDSADKDSRANTENTVAYALAEAPPNGVDLKWAEKWARDAVDQATLPAVTKQMAEVFAGEKDTGPEAKSKQQAMVREFWASTRAASLQTLADVYFHENKLTEASAAVDEAQSLDPIQGANFTTRGQIEHARHRDDRALEALETAEVYGGMTPVAEDLLTTLYAAQHGGSRSGLDAEIDHRYEAAFKPVPAMAHSPASSGRSVLLALYTGSGCEPCVAADLALDAVLRDYPRTEVVALAFDEHIPQPDPLANPASVARAMYDSVHYTPSFRMDGEEPKPVFGRRSDVEKAYHTLATALDAERSIPSGVLLHLSARLTPEQTVNAKAEVTVPDVGALHTVLATKPVADPALGTPVAPEHATTPAAPRLVLNFALVQREVRYSGENGIRFHAMVVRDLARPTSEGFPVTLTGSSSASFAFDPAAVSARNSKYLADFARHNERFAAPHFLTTDTTLPPDQLAVAAWVEDLSSHRVVAAAFSPLTPAGQTQQAAR